MKLVFSVSAAVLILGLAGSSAVLAARDEPREGAQAMAPAAPASAVPPVAVAPVEAPRPAASTPTRAFAPPPDSAIPNNEFGKEVKLGQAIFNGTSPLAAAFVGNSLRCASCHLDAGRLANSAPLWGGPIPYHWGVQAGALLSMAAAAVTLAVSGKAWIRQHNPVDLACAVATSGWLVYLLASSASFLIESRPLSVFAAHAGYQVAAAAVSFFLLVSASITDFKVYAVWMAQGVAGMLLLTLYAWGPAQQDLAYQLWVALNLVCASALSVYLGLIAYRQGTYRFWLVLGGSVLGLGICFEDLLAANGLRGPTFAQYFFATFLLLLWLLITDRAGPPARGAASGTHYAHPTAWDTVTGFGPSTELATAAVASERRRIAQDLHDGVGSQLVNILATLDTRAPLQKEVALALEHCLMDLKITVDSIDTSDDNVIDALGRLRYRVQHSLDKLGIRMVWKADVDGPLQAFIGDRAQQVLRITQECLSNIMRHAHPSAVEVICRYLPESDSLLLEVRDNGLGIARREAGRPVGKGLEGMRLRASKLGGQLQIATKAQVGTRVRLVVPLHPPNVTGRSTTKR